MTISRTLFAILFMSALGCAGVSSASAAIVINPNKDNTLYTWSSAQMVTDVQAWLDDSGDNFGWLVLGDESTIATAKRFDSRESASAPVLTIQYIPGPRVAPTPR